MANRNLRPISLGDIFDEGFDLYKKNFLVLLLTVAIVLIPLEIVESVISEGLIPQLAWLSSSIHEVEVDIGHFDSMWGDFLSFLESCAIVTVFCLVPYSIAILATLRLAASRYLGETLTVGEAYIGLLKRIVPVVITSTVYIVFLFLCYIGCIVPILIPLLGFPFVAFTLTLENKSVFKSFGRAWSLANGDVGRVFGCIFLLVSLATVITLGCKYPIVYGLDLFLSLLPGGQGILNDSITPSGSIREIILNQIGVGIALLLTTPLLVSVLTVFYFDLRVRKEAFDIQLLAKDLNYPELDLRAAVYAPAAYQIPVPAPGKAAPVKTRFNSRKVSKSNSGTDMPPTQPPGGMA